MSGEKIMGLQVKAGAGSAPRVQREIAKKGPRAAIISGIVDLGIQKQDDYKGTAKPDCREFLPILTLVADKYADEEGVKHNMVTSPWPVRIILGEKSNYTKFCKACDPNGEVLPDGVGDITQLIGRPVFANMTHSAPQGDEGIVYANCKGVSEIPEDYPLAETVINEYVFDSDNPDREAWDQMWDSTKERVRKAVNWDEISRKLEVAGLAKQVGGDPIGDGGAVANDFEDDIPF